MFSKKISSTKFFITIILIVAAFLRLWNLPLTMQFLGDQGRDALIAKRILIDHRPVLIGPVTSTGNMYLGPLYYYFMVPFLALTYPSPLGPAYAVAICGILAVFLTYYLGQEIVGKRAALIAALFFALSSVAVTFSRFSWNPNLAPLFSIILIWSIYRALKRNPWYFALSATCIAILMQLHYVTLLTVPVAGLFWLVSLRQNWRKGINRNFVLATLASIAIFLLFLLPLVLFDLRHNFLNFHALQTFLTADSGGFAHTRSWTRVVQVIGETQGRSLQILAEMYLGKFRALNSLLVLGMILSLIFWAFSAKNKYALGYQILLANILVSVIGLAFYQSTVFYHYIAFLYPVAFLIYGVILDKLANHQAGMMLGLIFFIWFANWNWQNMPFKPLSWNVYDVQKTAQTILARVKPGEKYNIVLLTGTGDIEGQNYRYFLDTSSNPPLAQEQWGQTDTLFIINEDKKLKKVTDSPIYEIVVFPNKNPVEVYTIPNGPEITVLRRSP